MITAVRRAMPLLLLLAGSAWAKDPTGASRPLVPNAEMGTPTVIHASSNELIPATTAAAVRSHWWGGAPNPCDACSNNCAPGCTFCDKLALPPIPGRPDWFVVGRITCRTPPHPFGYGEAAVIGLYRGARRSGLPIATLGDSNGTVLRADAAYPDFRAGGMARLGRMFTPHWGVEYSYLGASAWNGDAAVRDETPNAEGGLGNLFSPFGQFGADPVAGFDYNDFVSISGWSRIDSHELSLRQRLDMPPEPLQVSVFYGLRHICLDERFGYRSESQVPLPAGASQSVNVQTENDLFGVQLGTLLELHVDPRWWVDVRMAAALYRNRAAQTTVYRQTGGFPAGNSLDSRNEHGTIGAEVSLACAYALLQNLTVRFGYHFLWLDRVALATENFETNPALLQNGPGQLDVAGTVMYHGPFLGAAMTW